VNLMISTSSLVCLIGLQNDVSYFVFSGMSNVILTYISLYFNIYLFIVGRCVVVLCWMSLSLYSVIGA